MECNQRASVNMAYNVQLYCDCVPEDNRWKLDRAVDFEHSGVQIHLGEIANFIDEWEGSVATRLGLTKVDMACIKEQHPGNLNLQA